MSFRVLPFPASSCRTARRNRLALGGAGHQVGRVLIGMEIVQRGKNNGARHT
jgi:hypothetical protein